jgi:predicted HNH restriction endonuclease
VTVNKYERDPAAREKCLAKYGHKCSDSELDFEDQYGDIGKDFIYVHHLKELSPLGRDTRSIRLRTSDRSARTAMRCYTSGARRSPPMS